MMFLLMALNISYILDSSVAPLSVPTSKDDDQLKKE